MRLRFIAGKWISLLGLSLVPLFWKSYVDKPYFDFVMNGLYPLILYSVAVFIHFKIEDKEKKRFIQVIMITFLFVLIYQIFQEINRDQSLFGTLYGDWGVFWLCVYLSLLIYCIFRLRKDIRYLNKTSSIVMFFILGACFVVTYPMITYSYNVLSQDMFSIEFILFFFFIIIDSLALISLTVILILYYRLNYGFYWLVLVSSFGIMIFRDIAVVYYAMMNNPMIHAVTDSFIFILYTTNIAGLMMLHDPFTSLDQMRDIEKEREFYKIQYEEMEYLSKDLITVTELWFHDFKNDINVIKNALEIFLETEEEKFLSMLTDRINLVEDRQERYQAPANLLDSLKIQPIAVNSLRDIQKGYRRVAIDCPKEPIYVKANKLLFPVVLNIIHNAFQHSNKEDLHVNLDISEEDDKVFLKIKDDGQGIADDIKSKIFEKNYIRDNKSDSGMGLYLAKITIDKYGGKIFVEDNIPTGAIFTIELQKMEK